MELITSHLRLGVSSPHPQPPMRRYPEAQGDWQTSREPTMSSLFVLWPLIPVMSLTDGVGPNLLPASSYYRPTLYQALGWVLDR